ncbi:MAG: hypothetical protein JWL65_2224 [Gammaproteobacteria bacterium]|nr:hypothetical protein [Gammaproteobacteria bacterium]
MRSSRRSHHEPLGRYRFGASQHRRREARLARCGKGHFVRGLGPSQNDLSQLPVATTAPVDSARGCSRRSGKGHFVCQWSAVATLWLRTRRAVLHALLLACMPLLSMLASSLVLAQTAITATDLTQDTSGGKKVGDVASNLNTASQQIATLVIQIVSVGGFVVVALSLYQLWKASKDEREAPTPAIVGLFVGGAMAGVGTIMWIMKSTVTG